MKTCAHSILFTSLFLTLSLDCCTAQQLASSDRRAMVPTDQAIAQFEKRVADNNDSANRSILGQLYLRRAKEEDRFHDYVAAEKQFQSILNVQPNNHSAQSLLAYSYLSQHKFRESLGVTDQILRNKPENKICLAMNFDALMQLGNYEKAKTQIDRLLAITRNPSSLVRLASYQETFGQNESAIATMKEAVNLQLKLGDVADRDAWYHLRYAQILFDAGKIEDSKRQVDHAIKLKEEYPQAIALLGRIHAALNNNHEAVELLQRAVNISAEPPTLIALADLHSNLKQDEAAQDLYRQVEEMMDAEEKDPLAGPPHARERAIYFSNHEKRLGHAEKLARGDLKFRGDIVTHDTLAWALYQNGNHSDALNHARQATATGTKNAEILFHSGMIEIASGNKSQGYLQLKAALKSNPYFCSDSIQQIKQILNSRANDSQ